MSKGRYRVVVADAATHNPIALHRLTPRQADERGLVGLVLDTENASREVFTTVVRYGDEAYNECIGDAQEYLDLMRSRGEA